MDPARLTLAQIRDRLAAEDDEARLTRWYLLLETDERAGARALAVSWHRRRAAARAECERVAALFERRAELMRCGARRVAGVDEVGVGPLAGPVVAAAVVLAEHVDLPGLGDSKKLSRAARERIEPRIRAQALGIGIGRVETDGIDRHGIYRASLTAMARAVGALRAQVAVDHVLVDARTIPGLDIAQTPLVHGDAIDGSIAAASIVAKVYRDALMCDLDTRFPGYGFARHMGYGTAEHVAALGRLGASPVHRRSFAPVAAVRRP